MKIKPRDRKLIFCSGRSSGINPGRKGAQLSKRLVLGILPLGVWSYLAGYVYFPEL